MNWMVVCKQEVQSRVAVWVAVTVVPLSVLIVRRRLLIATTHSRHAQCKHLPVTATRFLHNSFDTFAINCTAHLSGFILFTFGIVHFVTYLHLFVCSMQHFVCMFCAALCLYVLCSILFVCSVQHFVCMFCAALCLYVLCSTLFVCSVQHFVSLLMAPICHFLITHVFLILFVCLLSILCVSVFLVYFFLHLYIAVSLPFSYKSSDNCHRVETHLQ